MFFRPFPELPPEWQSPKAQDTLLREYINHRGNFADFALDRGLSIDQLYDWLHSEQVIEKCKRLEAMANRQSALLATLIRPDALKALADVIISPDSTPAQRRLAASAVLRACDRLNRPPSRSGASPAAEPPDRGHPASQGPKAGPEAPPSPQAPRNAAPSTTVEPDREGPPAQVPPAACPPHETSGNTPRYTRRPDTHEATPIPKER